MRTCRTRKCFRRMGRSETGERRKEHCRGMPFTNPGRPSTPRLDPEGQRLRVRGPGALYLREGEPQLVPARVGRT